MAEVEYAGVKVGGSKLLLILPLLGTIVGGLWGGFELYNRLMDAEEKISALQPQAILNEVARMESVFDFIKEDLEKYPASKELATFLTEKVEPKLIKILRNGGQDLEFLFESY